MKKNRLIIVEGPQGTGKSTLANYLRENISGSNLYRLSGQKDKTITGKQYSSKMYQALLEYLNVMQDIPMDLIFDRTFTTDEVYARAGYKEYNFTDVYQKLVEDLAALNYEIYYFSLCLNDTKLFRDRLIRDSHHNYQSFSEDNSINQQRIYKEIIKELKKYNNIKVFKIEMDNFDEAYKRINKILNINN